MNTLPITNLEAVLPFHAGERKLLHLLNLPGAAKVVLAALDGGVTIPPHPMPCEATVLLLTGSIEFLVRDVWRKVEVGEFLRVPGGVMHSVRALEASRFLVVQSFVAPPAKA